MPSNAKSVPKAKNEGADKSAPMSFADAAEFILRREGKALNYRKLTSIAIKEGLIQTESKTPEISMHVSLRTEIRRREQRGEPQRFAFLGGGIFTLIELITGAPAKKTKSAVEQVRDSRLEAGQALYKKLTSEDLGSEFEAMVADLLIALGYEGVEVIGGKDDQGVDIVCERRDGITVTRVAIQCKCKSLKNKIGPKDVSTLRDNLSTYQCQQGILVTTTELNPPAKAKAQEPGKDRIQFIEHTQLLDLFAENQIGIRSETVRFFQLDSSQYEFLE